MTSKSANKTILKFLAESGVDQFANESPKNNLKKVEAKIEAAVTKSPLVKPAPLLATSSESIAENCNDLATLKAAVLDFKELAICKTATNTVFGDGNPEAKIMLIGEAPGADEDLRGIPFCGASGQLLDKMLASIGLFRDKNFYITNTIFWRPPGNRKPTPQEIAICKPFVEKHIALIKPEIIILVGSTAVSGTLNTNTSISTIRGRWQEYNNKYLNEPIATTAIFHPSYLLRSPGHKKTAWFDLIKIENEILKRNISL